MSYTKLLWIRNSTAAMYIDTGYKPNQDTRVHMKISNPGQNAYFFNSWSDNWNKNNYSCINDYAYSNGKMFVAYGDQTGGDTSVLSGENEIDYNKNTLTINGNVIASFEYIEFQSLYNMYLFAQNRKDEINYHTSDFAFNLHWCKIYENDVLLYDFIPVLDENEIACLYDNISNMFFYNKGTGVFLTYAYNDGYYLIRNNTNIYSIINDELTLLQETEVNSDLFKNYGIGEVPDWFYIKNLINPEVLYWQSKADNVPKLIANMKATPLHQNIITNPIDLTDASIKGIESITITCENNPLFAVSFDNKLTWKAWNGTSWVDLSEDFSGMSKEILEQITIDNWRELYTGATEMFIRISLTNKNQIVHKIDVDFLN